MAEFKVKDQGPRWALPFQIWKRGKPHPYQKPECQIVQYTPPTRYRSLKPGDETYLFNKWYAYGLQLDPSKVKPVSINIPHRDHGDHVFSTLFDPLSLNIPGKELVKKQIGSPLTGSDGLMYFKFFLFAFFASGAIEANKFLRELMYFGVSGRNISPSTLPLYERIPPEIRNILGYEPLRDWGNTLQIYVQAEVQRFKKEREISEILARKAAREELKKNKPQLANLPARWTLHIQAIKYAGSPEGSWLKGSVGIDFPDAPSVLRWILKNKPKNETTPMSLLFRALIIVNGDAGKKMEKWMGMSGAYTFIQMQEDARTELNRTYSLLIKKRIWPTVLLMLENVDPGKFKKRLLAESINEETVSSLYLKTIMYAYLPFAQHFGAPKIPASMIKQQLAKNPFSGWVIRNKAVKYASSPEGTWLKGGADIPDSGYISFFKWILEKKPKNEAGSMLLLALALGEISGKTKKIAQKWITHARSFAHLEKNKAARNELNRVYSRLLGKEVKPTCRRMIKMAKKSIFTEPPGKKMANHFIKTATQVYLAFARHFGAPELPASMSKQQQAKVPAQEPYPWTKEYAELQELAIKANKKSVITLPEFANKIMRDRDPKNWSQDRKKIQKYLERRRK